MSEREQQPARGRPRQRRIDEAIEQAVAAIIAEQGYDALTIEGVAARAGVGRPAIYRRYANKTDMAIATVAHIAARDTEDFAGLQPRTATTGALEGDLELMLTIIGRSFDRLVDRGIVPAFLGDLVRDPALAARFFTAYIEQAQEAVRERFTEAARRGEIASGAVPEVFFSMLLGSYVYHRFVVAHPFGETERRFVARVLAAGLRGEPR